MTMCSERHDGKVRCRVTSVSLQMCVVWFRLVRPDPPPPRSTEKGPRQGAVILACAPSVARSWVCLYVLSPPVCGVWDFADYEKTTELQ
jgi:hypothetical protein